MVSAPKPIDFPVKLTKRQTEAWDLLECEEVREVLYGGAKGGGKSHFGCLWVFGRALDIITEFKLTSRTHPIHIGFMGRKQATDFNKTTLESWKQVIPDSAYQIRPQRKEIIIGHAVTIDYGGLDRTEDIEKFNSAQYAFFFIDQAEEVSEDDIGALRASLRLKIGARPLVYQGLLTANPRRCWLKPEFISNPTKQRRFVQALPRDNPNLPDGYEETIQQAFKHRPELIQAYLYGSWDVFEGADQIIRDLWVQAARDRTHHIADSRIVIPCDVARFGDDETVTGTMRETELVDMEIWGKKDTMYTVNKLYVRQQQADREYGCRSLIVVDEGTFGGGVYDRLVEMDANVIAFNSAFQASKPEHFYNLRAEAWSDAGQMFAEGDVQLHYRDPERLLEGQLCTPAYKFRAGRVLVEPKADIKQRLKRSPDRADMYVMGLWGLRFADRPVRERDAWADDQRECVDAMAM